MEQQTLVGFITQLGVLAVFAVFVTGLVEIEKVFIPDKWETPKMLKFLTFGTSVYVCQALGFGIMQKIFLLTTGDDEARWVDYLATSGVVAMGARAAFDTIDKYLVEINVAKKKLNGG